MLAGLLAGALEAQVTQNPQPAPSRPAPDAWRQLAAPVIEGPFVRPADSPNARPIWGHAHGLRVGLAPMPGPRGLLRIYAPYLGHDDGRVINFIAVEPIAQGRSRRGFSELEPSTLDGVQGKRFWSADQPGDFTPRQPQDHPARGALSREGDVSIVRVHVLIEPFDNGARPYLRLTFRSDRPYEVGLATFADPQSKPLANCILSATMGNFARLRQLYLTDKVALAHDLWPDYRKDGFTLHRKFPLSELFRTGDAGALVAATGDEADPQQIKDGFPFSGWRYFGQKATQYWRCEQPHDKLFAQVNGRFTYYLSKSEIPGGIAFENFELVEPFRDGAEYWFGVTKQTPRELGINAVAGNAGDER